MRILIVDDDRALTAVLQENLKQQNYALDIVTDGEQGWIYGSTYSYDLIILDWLLPKLDGISLCRRFRTEGYQVPILLLTARKGRRDRILGLDSGADDYLSKPFDIGELGARIRSLIRRSSAIDLPTLQIGDLKLNPSSSEVTYNEKLVLLTAKEYELLELFLSNRQEVISIEDIIENLWPLEDFPSEATVRSHLRRLRQKLKLVGLPDNLINTVRGRGYYLNPLSLDQKSIDSGLLQKPESLSQKQICHLEFLTVAWEKYREKSQQQLKVLMEVAKAWLGDGSLTEADREQAALISHKLTGNLGLFGFKKGSNLAQKLEQILEQVVSQTSPRKHESAQLFHSILSTLHQELTSDINLPQQTSHTLPKLSPLLLIVDHDAKLVESLTQAARKKGIQTKAISTPALVWDWLKSAEPQQLPDVAIIRVPSHQTHWEQLALIADFKLSIPSIPVLVISDSDRFSDRLHAVRHGGSFYLASPFEPTQIINRCQQLLKYSMQSKKLMLVDDDVDFLQFLSASLKPWGFEMILLNDPRHIGDKLKAACPDLLVLDIAMPYLSGIEVCKVVRSHPQWCELPILFLSAYGYDEMRDQAFASGGNDFVSKSITPKKLVDRIANCL